MSIPIKDPWHTEHHICPVSASPFHESADLSTCAKCNVCLCAVHIQLCTAAVCKLPSQTNVKLMPSNIWPITIYLIVRLPNLGVLRRRYWHLLEFHSVPSTTSYIVFMNSTVPPYLHISMEWAIIYQWLFCVNTRIYHFDYSLYMNRPKCCSVPKDFITLSLYLYSQVYIFRGSPVCGVKKSSPILRVEHHTTMTLLWRLFGS